MTAELCGMARNAPVSVIVPCYKCSATIERAVSSIAQQTHRPAELILVNDASGDETLGVLKAIKNRYDDWIHIVDLPFNVGAASARNAGWNVATQPYIAFLDSDDAWHPRKIEIQYGYMRDNPGVVLSGHLSRQLPEGATETPQWAVEPKGVRTVTWAGLLLRHQFITPSVMIKKEIGFRFSDGNRYMEDHRLWLEIVSAPMLAVRLDIELAAVYKPVYGASGLSGDLWSMEKAELANYRYFRDQGKIPQGQFMALWCYSVAKFMRRLMAVYLIRRV